MNERDHLEGSNMFGQQPAVKRRLLEPYRSVKSPAFGTYVPRITNAELLGPDIRTGVEQTWAAGTFEERSIDIFRVENAYVVNESLVFDENLQVIANVADDYSHQEQQTALSQIKRHLATRNVTHYIGTGIVAKRRVVNDYGRYLLTMAPLALIGKRLFGESNPWYLTHRAPAQMQDVILRSLRLLGIGLDRVLTFDFGEPARFDEITFITGLAVDDTYLSPLAVQAIVELGAPVSAGAHRKLFVRSNPGWDHLPEMMNEGDTARRLAAEGFHVIDPAALSLEEQISAFKGADHVVGPLAAGMANIVFCQSGTKVELLCSGASNSTFLWFTAMHRQLDYSEIRGDYTRDIGIEPAVTYYVIREVDVLRLEGLPTASARPLSTGSSQDTIEGATVLAHVQNIGDITCALGNWSGTPNRQQWVEGFAINLPDHIAATDIEYEAIHGSQMVSPPASGGSFCGTRGRSLPIRGLRVRIGGELATRYDCFYSATFADGTKVELVSAGEVCAARTYAPLETFMILLRRRV